MKLPKFFVEVGYSFFNAQKPSVPSLFGNIIVTVNRLLKRKKSFGD